jgi:ribose transport system substrate-binding protein
VWTYKVLVTILREIVDNLLFQSSLSPKPRLLQHIQRSNMSKRPLIVGALALSAALVLSGCASGSSDSGGDVDPTDSAAIVAAAQAVIDEYKQVPSTSDLGDAIDVSALAGKKIISLPIDSKLEFYQVGENSMKAIAEEAGLEYMTFPTDGSPTSFQQGFALAIAEKAGAILLNGPLPETLAPQLAEAEAAGIPVIPVHISDQSEAVNPATPYEAFAPFNLGARLSALYAVIDLKGEPIKALVLEASGTGPSDGMVQTITDTLATEAPAGSEIVTSLNIQVPEWSTDIQPAVQSALLANPEINAVIPIYDSMALFAIPGIDQAAADKNLGVYSFNGTPAVMKLIQDGDTMRSDAAENPDWVSYVNLDTAFRAMLGVDPIAKVSGPLRVIDKSNVDETGTPPESGLGFGTAFPGAYLKLWGLG